MRRKRSIISLFTIYRLVSPSGKSYIGLTQQPFSQRWVQHLSTWRTKHYNCRKLCYAFDKYPPEVWTKEILAVLNNKEEAENKEIEYIKLFDTVEHGYNVLRGGKINRIGIKHSEETKLKISLVQKGKKIQKNQKRK